LAFTITGANVRHPQPPVRSHLTNSTTMSTAGVLPGAIAEMLLV